MPRKLSLLLLFLLPGCAAAQTVRPAITTPDTLDRYIEREMRERRIPGLALAITRNGQILGQRGYGLASVQNDVPVTPATRFALASLTKQFTAVGIMMLVEEGKIDLDASITRYLSDAPPSWQPVTVRHLLTHTSGMPPIGEGFRGDPRGMYDQVWISTAESWAAARTDTLHSRPGQRWAYSDVGYFVLGIVTEQVSGTSWREFMRGRIFEPLGMTDTFILDHVGIHRNLAHGYTLRNDTLINLHRPWQFEQPSHFGIFSTVGDLAKWDAALYTDRLLSESSRRQMWTPVRLSDGSTHPYGFGWEVERPCGHAMMRHTGITGTEMVRLPDDTVTVIVLTNLGRGFGGTARSWGIAREIGRMLVPALQCPSPGDPGPARPVQRSRP
ncbi:MAG: beta-lactamase family protein [Gemmatimonadota bacterium]|nr:beta-lactamase family protein [Gemmatimonadota bacterium]